MSAASMTSISKSLRRSTSWADDDDDDWDFNTWKQQIEIEASPEPVTPMESISGSLDKYTSWADDEDDWNFEDWKQQAEKDNSPLTIEELGPLQRQTQEEPTYQTIHPCSNFASSEPMPEEAFATYYTEEQLQLQLTNDPAVYFNDPPTMHWYCINKAEGCDRPQNWRYEYTKTWRALRRNIPTHPKTHRQTPLISSPLALQATVVDDERHSMPAIAKGLVDETGDEHPLTPELPDKPEALKTNPHIHSVTTLPTTGTVDKSAIIEPEDAICDDTDECTPTEWEHSSTSRSSTPSSDVTDYDTDLPSANESETAIDIASGCTSPELEGYSSSDTSFNMLNDNDNSSGGGKELLVSDKELETKTALVMVQKCSKSSSHASLGLHTTTADGPDVLSGVYLASPEVVTKDCKQCCPSFSVRSASPSSKSESRKPKLFTWSDYSSVGIAAVAAVAVAGSLFLAFGRRRR